MTVIAKLHTPGSDDKRKPRRLRYVQTLPTLCTLGNLICGFGAIHLCLRAMWLAGNPSAPLEIIERHSELMERLLPTHIVMAAYLVFLAMVFDALDGRVARLTRHTTDFGAQLDSLADMVSFGAAPALLVITLLTRQIHGPDPLVVAPISGNLLGRVAWCMAAIYVACAAMRLARFNVETEPDEESHLSFRGLPSPGAAAALACLVILHDHVYFYDRTGGAKAIAQQGGWLAVAIVWSLPVLALLIGLLMVSRFRYVHMVNRYLRGRLSFAGMVKLFFLVALGVAYPEIALPVLVVGYALSGPVVAIYQRRRGKSDDSREEDDVEIEPDAAEEIHDLVG